MRHATCCIVSGFFLFLTGCAAALQGGDKIAKFHATDDDIVTKAPKGGSYVVVYRAQDSNALWEARHVRRELKRGEDLGFTHDDQGRVVAIAGKFEKTLGPMPLAQYCCWYRLSDDYVRGRQLRKVLRQTAATVGAAAIVGAAEISYGVAKAELEANSDNPTPEWVARETRHRIR